MIDRYQVELKLSQGEKIIKSFLGIYLTNKRIFYSGTGSYQANKDDGSTSTFSFRNMINLLLPDVESVNIGSLQEQTSKPTGLMIGGILLLIAGIVLMAASSGSYGSDSGMIGGGVVMLVIGIGLLIGYAMSGTSSSSNISIIIKTAQNQIKSSLYSYGAKTTEEADKIFINTINNGQDFINAVIEAKQNYYNS